MLPRCACGARAVVFAPGSEAEVASIGGVAVTIGRGVPVTGRCLRCCGLRRPAADAPRAAGETAP